MTVGDYKRLAQLILDRAGREQEASWLKLAEELERASVVADDSFRSATARMHSTVSYRDEMACEGNIVQLVYPHEADGDSGRLSVLTPIGAALIGMSEGQRILWTDGQGRRGALAVEEVRDGPI